MSDVVRDAKDLDAIARNRLKDECEARRAARRPQATTTEEPPWPKVFVSSVVNAPAGQVWALVRDFNGLPAWTPFVAESRIELGAPADQVGCIRNFPLKDGGRIRERLLALSDYEFSMTYSILESPMGVENYVATLRLTPVTDGDRAYAEWTADFDCPPQRESELVDPYRQERLPGRLPHAPGCASPDESR